MNSLPQSYLFSVCRSSLRTILVALAFLTSSHGWCLNAAYFKNGSPFPTKWTIRYEGTQEDVENHVLQPNESYQDEAATVNRTRQMQVYYQPDPSKPNEWVHVKGSPNDEHVWNQNQNWYVALAYDEEGSLVPMLIQGRK